MISFDKKESNNAVRLLGKKGKTRVGESCHQLLVMSRFNWRALVQHELDIQTLYIGL